MIKIILDWLKKNLVFLIGGFAIFLMLVCFVSGCQYHKHHNPCPEPTIVTHTVILHDTVTHYIDKWHYSQHTDTILYPDTIIQPVDTARILADHFALHVYSRTWEDTLIKVDLRDTVTQNKFLQNEFSYRILRPQTIIHQTLDQSIHYNKYLYLGFDIPFKGTDYAEIEALFCFRRGAIGFGYAPLKKGYSLNLGLPIAKFR